MEEWRNDWENKGWVWRVEWGNYRSEIKSMLTICWYLTEHDKGYKGGVSFAAKLSIKKQKKRSNREWKKDVGKFQSEVNSIKKLKEQVYVNSWESIEG